MKRIAYHLLLLLMPLWLAACHQTRHPVTIVLTNSLPYARTQESVEIPVNELLERLRPEATEQFVVLDGKGLQIPYQLTYDDKLLFMADIAPKGKALYTIGLDSVMPYEARVSGRYSEHDQALVWENDRIAFRAFSADYGQGSDRAAGYDVWVKNTGNLMLDEWFDHVKNQADSVRQPALLQQGETVGMDVYRVGETLGCGSTALWWNDSTLTYPRGWNEYEILDNGPLRFTARLKGQLLPLGSPLTVTEIRTISLDAGSLLNRINITYDSLPHSATVFTAVPLRTNAPECWTEKGLGIVAYADPTDSTCQEHGKIYVGCIVPEKIITETGVQPLNPAEAAYRGATGYGFLRCQPEPGKPYCYLAGAGWTNGGMPDYDTWKKYLAERMEKELHPLRIELK